MVHFTALASSFIVALGGFLLGFDQCVLLGATKLFKNHFLLEERWFHFFVMTTLLGAIMGATGSGKLADLLGRKRALLGVAFIYLLSAFGCATAWSSEIFALMRALCGVAMGGISVIVPLYIAEIASAERRGRQISIFQLNIAIGILASFVSHYSIALAPESEGPTGRWMLGIVVLPALLYLLLLLLISESPRWLVLKGRLHAAAVIFTQLKIFPSAEKVAEICANSSLIKADQQETLAKRKPLFQTKYFRPLLLVGALAIFHQLSGIHALIYDTPLVFAMAGTEKSASLLQSLAMGLTNVLFTFVAMLTVDVIGRRPLIRWGSIGMGVCLLIVAWQFSLPFGGDRKMIFFGLLGFIAFFSFSQGVVLWIFMSEIFSHAIRAKGQSFGTAIYWAAAAFVSWIFPMISRGEILSMVFTFFALLMFLQFLWALYIMPETNGRKLEEAQDFSPSCSDEDWRSR